MAKFEKAKDDLGAIFKGLPPLKLRSLFNEMNNVENTMNRMASMLHVIRQYFIDTSGEESGEKSALVKKIFVKKIDEMLERREEEGIKTPKE